MTKQSESLDVIQKELSLLSAAEVAELFLSPYVRPEFLNQATAEPGPSMWIVNRSDVYDETLEALKSHPISAIAERAKEKWAHRHSSLSLISPPMIEAPLEETPDYAVEDILGHPLAPFEAILFFSHSLNEDFRASSALSLTRRILEHPPNWGFDLGLKSQLSQSFAKLLLEDPSPFVRSYAARVPVLSASVLLEALPQEKSENVQSRLLQNPAVDLKVLETAATLDSLFVSSWRALAVDSRLPRDLRIQRIEKSGDTLERHLHEWHLMTGEN